MAAECPEPLCPTRALPALGRETAVLAHPSPRRRGVCLAPSPRLSEKASGGGAALAVFPEAFLPGYPRGITFGTVVGDRTREGREHFRRYFDASVGVPGPVVDRLAGIAAETALHLVIGVVERAGGTLYCTVLVLLA